MPTSVPFKAATHRRSISAAWSGSFAFADTAWAANRQSLARTLAEETASPQRHAFRAKGFYLAERFSNGQGNWTQSHAELTVPLSDGVLTLTLWAPRPGPVNLKVQLDGDEIAGPFHVGTIPQDLSLVVTSRGKRPSPPR